MQPVPAHAFPQRPAHHCLWQLRKKRCTGQSSDSHAKLEASDILFGKGAVDTVCLDDIGVTDQPSEWCDYVFAEIEAAGLPEPTDFYSGSWSDARWYGGHFANLDSGSLSSDGLFEVLTDPTTGKRIHIFDRAANTGVSSSDVRALIENRDPAWQDLVAPVLHDFYEQHYPPHLRAPIFLPADRAAWPKLGDVGKGTRGTLDPHLAQGAQDWRGPEGLQGTFVLRADGKWRPYRAETGKSLGDE